MSQHSHLYKTKKWRQLREVHLSREPLCQQCLKRGLTVAATVVHHIKKHNGDYLLFKDPNNLQSVCKRCHDGELQFTEIHKFSNRIDEDGWPADPNHPVNK